MQSIHTKQPILPVYINKCCDCSTSSSLGEIIIGMKAFCENKVEVHTELIFTLFPSRGNELKS